jgi:DNA-binding NarL/FixJ family response regulator
VLGDVFGMCDAVMQACPKVLMEKIRLLVVDDDPLWLDQLSRFLGSEPDLEVAGAVLTGKEALEAAMRLKPDLVLMDIGLSGDDDEDSDGIAIAFEILNQCNIRSIILTSISDEEVYLRCFSSGVLSYVEKKDFSTLPQEIRIVRRQRSPFKTLLADYRKLRREALLWTLSKSEREVFDLARAGMKRREIEEKLFRSDNTIRNHIKSINRKLHAKSIKDAVRKIEWT